MKALEEEGEGGKEGGADGRQKLEKDGRGMTPKSVLQSNGEKGKGEGGKEGGMEGGIKEKRLDSGKLVEKEAVGRGSVGAAVYKAYIRW